MGDYAIQRGWLNPHHQLFGQVTSRTRHHRLYRPGIQRLDTPRGTSFDIRVPASRLKMANGPFLRQNTLVSRLVMGNVASAHNADRALESVDIVVARKR